jgi:predicted transposase YdaD
MAFLQSQDKIQRGIGLSWKQPRAFCQAKTDPSFYRLFQNVSREFFEFIGRSSAEAIAYEFRSVDIKQPACPMDGVFILLNREIIELIETIVVNTFPQKSRQELGEK